MAAPYPAKDSQDWDVPLKAYIDGQAEDEAAAVAGMAARVRNLGGYKAPSTKCPLTKAVVSVTKNTTDGWDTTGPTYHVTAMNDVAETNWKNEHLVQYVAANYNYWVSLTGPWSTGENVATVSPLTGKLIKPLDFTFMFEGSALTFYHLFAAGLYVPDVRIWIDDEEIADWYLGARAGGVLQGKSLINAGAHGTGNIFYNINFPERGTYKVRVHGLVNTLGGAAQATSTTGNLLSVNSNSRVLKPTPRANVGVISDSLFEAIAANTNQSVAAELGHHLNANIWNYAMGGSGFNNPSASGANGDKSYPGNLVWQAVARGPALDLLIVNGSANDMTYTEAQNIAAMQATFDRARAYDPDIPIVWAGIEPGNTFKALYTLPAMKTREAALAVVARADPNVVAVIETCKEEWMTGTGRVGATTGNGNQDFVVGTDGTHLSAYGVRYYGKMLAERMKAALAVV